MNKSFTNVVIFLIIAYLIIMKIATLRETITWTNIIFLQRTPLIILVLLFGFTCCLLAATSIRTISIVNVFLLFFIVLLVFFVSFTNFQFKDYSLLQPVLENGYFPVIKRSFF
ncbi:GerAB/ArcD/ProY family transporter [Priestia aryabhattai]|uniref:GerAB/ArcD/ProY family transporter n=1 Tax=Priestia aryabhattai TaxID=412384 RepID=UPI003D27EAD7